MRQVLAFLGYEIPSTAISFGTAEMKTFTLFAASDNGTVHARAPRSTEMYIVFSPGDSSVIPAQARVISSGLLACFPNKLEGGPRGY